MFKAGKKYIKSSEELISMLLGLAIVIVIVSLVFNFVQRKKGTIEIPGSTDISLSENSVQNNAAESGVYVVEKGDSLWKIAVKKYNDGYSWTKIAKENNLKNVSVLLVGQKLKMPVIEVKVVANNSVVKQNISSGDKIDLGDYKVVRGDNLWKIAVRTYGDGYKWTKIWQENKAVIRNPGLLEIGMTLKLSKL